MDARGMDPLALALKHARDRILSQPINLETRHQHPKLARDRHIALRMTKTNRRGDKQRAPAPGLGARPARGGSPPVHELPDQAVHLHWVAREGNVPRTMECDQVSAGRPRERLALNERTDEGLVAVDHERRAAHPRAGVSEQFLARDSDSENGVE